ncbi:MAG: NAD(P)-dependent oxidoreductase [Candidatus Woykebacteria bacterium]
MKVLITGGGLAGTYSALEAEKQGFSPILFEVNPDEKSIKSVWNSYKVIVGDITDKKDFEKAVKDFVPDVIVHTAALRQRAVKADPVRGSLVNVEGTKLVVEVSSQANIPLVYTSSDSIYGTALESATSITEETHLEPKTLYAQTKLKAEKLITPYDKAVILRLTSVYGPWLGSASTFNEIIRDIVKAGIEGKEFEMAVPFAEKSEQLYVKDLAVAIINAVTSSSIKKKILTLVLGH